MLTDEAIYQKWSEWISAILADVQATLTHRYVYREVQTIIGANTQIQMSSVFYEMMAVQYAVASSIAVRRQIDLDADSISLARLMIEIKTRPQILSRERFITWFVGVGHTAETGSRYFDDIAGEEQAHISPSTVEADLQELQAKTDKIKRYTNRHIAHYDRRAPRDLPTLSDLDACMDCLERLTIRYALLIQGKSYTGLVPGILHDWTEIFRYPWMPSEIEETEDED